MPDLPEIPENLAGLSDEELSTLLAGISAAAQPFTAADFQHTDESIAAVKALADASGPVVAEQQARADRATAGADAAQTAASLAALAPAGGTDDEEEDDEPEAPALEGEILAPVVASRAPGVADIARTGQSPTIPAPLVFAASMVAAADVPGFPTGHKFTGWGEASQAMANRFGAYNSKSMSVRKGGRQVQRNVDVHETGSAPADGQRMQTTYKHQLKSFTRHGGVKMRREAPSELRLNSQDGRANLAKLEFAGKESRVAGGSLVASMLKDVKAGKSLVAAAGWCAPSETIYDLCEQETMDGLLAIPEVTADRGGFNIPIDGGIDFSTIFTSIGNAGDTHLTEAEVIADVVKVCNEIPCPEFEDVRLAVDYFCLTGSLLQRRGYPEVIGRFTRGAAVALAHKINAGVIAEIEAGSVDAGVVPLCESGDDAASALLSAVETAIVDMQYRARMSMSQSMEVVLPFFALAQIRAAMSRRRGVALMAVSDAEIGAWFAVRNAVPRFVYDWQDAFTGEPGGPGGAVPLVQLPTEIQFIVFPAGTWIKATAEVVDLDTIYDSTLLTTNQYTAAFVEDGWAVMQMCPLSRVYTVVIDPCGCLCSDQVVPTSP